MAAFLPTDATRTSSESDDEAARDGDVTSPKRKKPYKSTYYSRKSEISSLQSQIEALTQQLERVKAHQPVTAVDVYRACSENAVLQDRLQKSDLFIARTHSLVLGDMATNPRNPIDVEIRLSTNLEERQRTLNGLHGPVLDRAMRYIFERTHHMRLDQSQRQTHMWTEDNEDQVLVQCDVTPFPDVTDLKHVYDNIHLAIAHQEFQFWEHLGVTTVCHFDDPEDAPAKQARYISVTPYGIDLEKNLIRFRQLFPSSKYLDSEHGVIVLQNVDVDELHPYDPKGRVRIDVSSVVLVRAFPEGSPKPGVSVIRWGMTRVRLPECPLTREKQHELVDLIPRWGEVVRRVVKDYIQGK
ncbi:hypothetical protein Poli38472_014211 [Pythium oligandrum]|uniref:Uncharacterized protein n=1 Tax=Pythium oligandrum TaxID=41045 RepID=A0A8K1FKE1_PYTOL|nr:hypothetical protein Poli38472_014211 [Pythium oligandrum]|eukprot:TMW64094.1 hypothetical protein Poli38472_014211 [Pythium oligandrum]